MTNTRACLAVLAVAVAVSACQSTQQQLAASQPEAINVATKRAQFEFSCPQASARVLSSMMTQPAINGPLMRGIERAEYTIGVEGCGQKQTYIVVCPQDGSGGCFPGEGNN